MQQIWITKHGPVKTLEVRSAPSPELSPGQVRIRVNYSGINFADLMCRLGLYPGAPKPPFVPGYEVSGIVDKTGDNSLEHWVGKPVLAVTEFGGYSSEVIVHEKFLIPLANEALLETAAAIPVNYFTAYGMMVTQANLQPDEWLLIHGIGGGVGIAALQISKILKAKVIGTASKQKHERLKSIGVAHLMDHDEDLISCVREITDGRGADVILDPIGGTQLKRSYAALAPLGRLINYGFSTAASGNRRFTFHALKEYLTRMKFDPLEMMSANKGVFGFHLGRLKGRPDFHRKAVRQVMDWYNNGDIAPVIDKVFKFSDVQDAHQYIHDRLNFGKILLTPDD